MLYIGFYLIAQKSTLKIEIEMVYQLYKLVFELKGFTLNTLVR